MSYETLVYCNLLSNTSLFVSYQHLAAGKGHDDIVNFLVREGANVNAEGNLFS